MPRLEIVHTIHPDTLVALRSLFTPWTSELHAIRFAVDRLNRQKEKNDMDLTRLAASVAKNTDALKSAEVVLAGVAQQIRDAAGDQSALNALADQLASDDAGLADAIVASTTTTGNAPTPPPPPPPAA